ncbi:MAG: thioredoxin family protein [Oscillospiraceae bacterium]|nr:thioredoxin family protein [Oscillospiraceae bacterium]
MKVVMFMLKNCPYCKKADKYIEELCAENPKYSEIEIARIDEKENALHATKYDYFYVPSFYINEVKYHEGAASKEDVKRVLDIALEN